VLADLGFTRPGYTEVLFPLGILILGSIPWRAGGVPLLIAVLVLEPWISILVLAACMVAFAATGIRLFLRGAID
jgi:hypothetical protein